MEHRFYKLTVATLIAVIMVVMAGSVVRTTGSGMGCPDWPRCFGQWVPPTSVDQIPENYKEIYAAKREKKIQDFCRYLTFFGWNETAERMRNDPTLLEEQDFNAGKTWTEYVNRLIGFIAGNLMLIQFVLSVIYFRNRKKIIVLSLLNLLLIFFTAWLGAIVVATNLLPWMITLHMALALLIIAIQASIIQSVQSLPRINVKPGFRYLVLLVLLLSLVQIVMGTQVRQQIDVISDEFSGERRDLWVQNLQSVFYVHRTFSLLIFALTFYLIYINRKADYGIVKMNLLLLVIAAEIVSGAVLSYLDMPAFLQPTHLLLSVFMLLLLTQISLRTQSVK